VRHWVIEGCAADRGSCDVYIAIGVHNDDRWRSGEYMCQLEDPRAVEVIAHVEVRLSHVRVYSES